jgi:hypothetical protein
VARLDPTAASRAVLIEVSNVLGAYRNELVMVGGWVPDLLYPGHGHIGSLDVDLAVSPMAYAGNAYDSILRRMASAGYEYHADPTRFVKTVAGAENPVKVDLLSGQGPSGEASATVHINELRISRLRGIDLAFAACDEIELFGAMPDGTVNKVRIRVVRPEAFILIKAFALDERTNEKDAYDIAFVLQHYEPTLTVLADRVRVLLENALAREGLQILNGKFESIDSVGPVWAARVSKQGGADYEQARRAAFENAQELFRSLDAPTA